MLRLAKPWYITITWIPVNRTRCFGDRKCYLLSYIYPKDPSTFSDDDWGVYNHLQKARYSGSITILRRWARIPRVYISNIHHSWIRYMYPASKPDPIYGHRSEPLSGLQSMSKAWTCCEWRRDCQLCVCHAFGSPFGFERKKSQKVFCFLFKGKTVIRLLLSTAWIIANHWFLFFWYDFTISYHGTTRFIN